MGDESGMSVNEAAESSPLEATLTGLLEQVELSSTKATRFSPVERWLVKRLELDVDRPSVRGTYVSEPKMVAPRLGTPGIVNARPDLVVAVVGREDETEVYERAIRRRMDIGTHLNDVLLARQPGAGEGWSFPRYFARPGSALAGRLKRMIDGLEVEVVGSPPAAGTTGGAIHPRSSASEPLIVVDERIRRMARHTIASSPATVFIGPPGTGKTTLVGQTLDELASNPRQYGLSKPILRADPVTPDESWTATDILGGPTVVDGEITFRLGHVLRAIRADRALVLDEANRADLDKIFGGLLTWLSGHEVVVGRLAEHPGAPEIRLGWSDGSASLVENGELLDEPWTGSEPADEPIRFLAGREWRLVATYNAVDAQRVFRFGEALGRRFAKVPVPPPSLLEVSELVTARCQERGLHDEAAVRITSLYEAHMAAEESLLGPASFLEIPNYVAQLVASEEIDVNDEQQLEDAIAEGYLTQVGLNLARLEEDELDRLGGRHVKAGSVSAEGWAWVRALLPSLRG